MCGEHKNNNWATIFNTREGKAATDFPVDYHIAFPTLRSLVLDIILFYSVSEKSDCRTENAMLERQFDILDRIINLELEDLGSTASWLCQYILCFFYFEQTI